jgi:hypothetical protein
MTDVVAVLEEESNKEFKRWYIRIHSKIW